MDTYVLIVEDDDQVASLLQATIAANYKSIKAKTAAEGLKVLEGRRDIALVILDLNLPDSQGADTVRLFKARFPQVPVFPTSGNASIDLERDCILAGAESFLPKPQLSLTLVEIVRHIIAKHQFLQQFKPAIQAIESAQEKLENLKSQQPKRIE